MAGTTKGMLEGTATAKPVLARLIDLYRGDTAFRGMTDFVVIGAVALMFLSPPNKVKWPWSGGGTGQGSSSTGGQQNLGPGLGGASSGGAGASITSPPKGTPGLVLPITYPTWIANPKLADTVIDIDPRAFTSSSAADQPRLHAAHKAYVTARGSVADILREADGNDRNVAFMRAHGLLMSNTAIDNNAAAVLLRTAMEKGHRQAGAALAWLLATTRPGIKTDLEEARRLIEKAAAAGDPKGMRLAAVGLLSGEFGRLDPQRAFDLAKQAADAGDAMATLLLSRLNADGIGSARGANGEEAERYLRAAAQAGLTDAQFSLGQWLIAQYEKGLLSDASEARDWLERARTQGHAMGATISLSALHWTQAKSGPLKDAKRAFEYVRSCSAFRIAACQFNMGAALSSGLDGSPDHVAALAHYEIARELQSPNAADKIKPLEAQLSAADRQAASAFAAVIRTGLQPGPRYIALQIPGIDLGPAPTAIAPVRTTATPGTTGTGTKTDTQGGTQPGPTTSSDMQSCTNTALTTAQRTEACTRVIDAGNLAPATLASAYYNRGYYRWQAGDYANAEKDLDEAVKRVPNNSYYLLYRGAARQDQRKVQPALDDIEASLRLRDEPFAHARRAHALLRLNRLQDALEAANKVTDGKLLLPYEVRAEIFFERKSWDEVVREATTGLGISPSNQVLLRLRGMAYFEKGDSQLALADFDDVIRRNPGNWLSYNERGRVHQRRGPASFDAALNDYAQAASSAGHDYVPHLNKARIHFDRKQFGQAIADLDQAIEQHKTTDLNVFLLRGRARLGTREYDLAVADFSRMIQLKGEDPWGYYWRGYARLEDAKATKAYCDAERQRAVQRSTSDIHGGAGGLRCSIPVSFSLALDDLNAAITRNGKLAGPHYQVGRLLREVGQFNDAIKALEAAHARDALQGDALYEIGAILHDNLNRKEAALEKFNQVIAINQRHVSAIASRANYYAGLGPRGRNEAIAGFRRALEIELDHEYSKNGLRKLGVAP